MLYQQSLFQKNGISYAHALSSAETVLGQKSISLSQFNLPVTFGSAGLHDQ